MVRITFRGQPRDCIEGQLVLKVRRDVYRDAEAIDRMLAETLGARNVTVVVPFDDQGIGLIELARGADIEETAATLERNPAVIYAEPNDITETSDNPAVLPADPRFNEQWSLQAIQAPAAWSISLGSGDVLIAVLDTGFAMAGNPLVLSHEDLNDPARVFLGGNYAAPGTPPRDDHGHGTHVAGIAGAESNNRQGIAGVNWRCRLLGIKVFFPPVGNNPPQGSAFMVYQGTQEAIAFAQARGWRLVINYSGGGRVYASVYEDCVRVARNAGAVFCAAATNQAGSVSYPAALSTRADGSVWYDNVIAVSATTRGDDLWPDSNRGIQVNVAAPGADILSTVPRYPAAMGDPSGYAPASGTSMATPHVSGLAALVWSVFPNFTPSQVREQIQATALDLGAPGRDPLFGYGRINAFDALRPVVAPPAPPPPPPPWEDAVVRAFIDEWVAQNDRCLKRKFPGAYVDRWGRACGNLGTVIASCNQNPDHPFGWDSYRYLWSHDFQGKYYPYRVREYVAQRQGGATFASLARCTI